MTEHTPGPWDARWPKFDSVIVDADERVIATVSFSDHADSECEANAHLIAAAPDLLEMARLLIRFCSDRDGKLLPYEDWIQCFVEDGSTITEVVDKAQAAIAKAEAR